MKPVRFAMIFFGLLLLAQFNNCTPQSDQNPFDNTSLLGACDPNYNPSTDPNSPSYDPNSAINTDCTLPDINNLEIDIQGGDIGIAAGLTDFNVAGYCNAAAYASNVVTWTLKLNGQAVRNSGMQENGQTWNGQCVNSAFNMRVFLEAIPEDVLNGVEVNRTGLFNPLTNSRTAYSLDVTIYGRDANGVLHQNTNNGTRTVNLFPD